jgi:predicted DNA-binding transcriptional regulator YafY|tara:strand:- start:1606 stop:1998 length:393 start_codon:yes stop_codon:yes gene_type:complete
MTLYNIFKNIILEQASQAEISDAIRNKHVCELGYEDDSKLGPGKRTIEPVALGLSKRNNKVLRAYQTEGPSLKVNEEGIPLPDWRLFRLDRIKSFKPKMVDGAFEDFSKPPLYNPFGDKSMNRVLLNAKF